MQDKKNNHENKIKDVIYDEPLQSANALFKFMREYGFLETIIERMRFTPRYNDEDISFLNLEYKFFSIPIVCFCDVPLNKLEKHIARYGGYGIAMTKEWGKRNKLQKIIYLTQESVLNNSIINCYKKRFSETIDDNSDLNGDLLISIFKYIKPINGIQNNQYIYYPDDCEWRYVPMIEDEEIPEIIPLKEKLEEEIEKLNIAINNHGSQICLSFNEEDIKYIIVPEYDDFKKMLSFLQKNNKENLISKILVWEQIKEDL